jgi:hypothetical protein
MVEARLLPERCSVRNLAALGADVRFDERGNEYAERHRAIYPVREQTLIIASGKVSWKWAERARKNLLSDEKHFTYGRLYPGQEYPSKLDN